MGRRRLFTNQCKKSYRKPALPLILDYRALDGSKMVVEWVEAKLPSSQGQIRVITKLCKNHPEEPIKDELKENLTTKDLQESPS